MTLNVWRPGLEDIALLLHGCDHVDGARPQVPPHRGQRRAVDARRLHGDTCARASGAMGDWELQVIADALQRNPLAQGCTGPEGPRCCQRHSLAEPEVLMPDVAHSTSAFCTARCRQYGQGAFSRIAH